MSFANDEREFDGDPDYVPPPSLTHLMGVTENPPCNSKRFFNNPEDCLWKAPGVPRQNLGNGNFCGLRMQDDNVACVASIKNPKSRALKRYHTKLEKYSQIAKDAMECNSKLVEIDPDVRTTIFATILSGTDVLSKNIFQLFDTDSTNVLQTNSASDTLVLKGKLRVQNVRTCPSAPVAVAKLSWDDKNKLEQNGLVMERKLYEAVFSLLTKHTPHLACVYAVGDNFRVPSKQSLVDKQSVALYNTITSAVKGRDLAGRAGRSALKNNLFHTLDIHCVVTEDLGTETFGDWIDRNAADTAEFKYDIRILLVQLIHALKNMARIGVQHNDLHLDNVFVQTMKRYTIIEYDEFRLKTNLCVKIFDWDRGLGPDLINTTLSSGDTCSRSGQCNAKNDRFDLVSVFMNFCHAELHPKKIVLPKGQEPTRQVFTSSHPKDMRYSPAIIKGLEEIRSILWSTMNLVRPDTASRIVENQQHPSYWCARNDTQLKNQDKPEPQKYKVKSDKCNENIPAMYVDRIPDHDVFINELVYREPSLDTAETPEYRFASVVV